MRVGLFTKYLCFICLILFGVSASGQDNLKKKEHEPVWYISIGGGSSKLEPEGDSAGFYAEGNNSTGSKFTFGQKFKSRLAWEFSYLDAGIAELDNYNPAIQATNPDESIEYKISSLFFHYYFMDDSSRFNTFVKAGASSIATSASDSRIIVNEEASAKLVFGLGADMRIGRKGYLRLEFDSYSKDASYTGISLGLRLGGKSYKRTVKQKVEKALPVVIEYPLYEPEEQVLVLEQDQNTITEVANELQKVSEELLQASTKQGDRQQSVRMARQARTLVKASERIAVVEESIFYTSNAEPGSIDPDNFRNEAGQQLLATPAEQSVELGKARSEIGSVERAVGNMPSAKQRLRRVLGRIAVVEESLLFVPPWEEEAAAVLCNDFKVEQKKIQFRSNATLLTDNAKKVLVEIAAKMNRNPRVIMEIHAHTDSWGTYAYNQVLSEKRAAAAVEFLVKQGVSRARLVARGYGELVPLAANNDLKGRMINRRVEFVIKNPNICQVAESHAFPSGT